MICSWANIQHIPEIRQLYSGDDIFHFHFHFDFILSTLSTDLLHYPSGPVFPIEIRHYFSDWIEVQQWDFHENDISKTSLSRDLFSKLLSMIRTKIEGLRHLGGDNFLLHLRMIEIADAFELNFSNNPSAFVLVVRQCLQQEVDTMSTSDVKSEQMDSPSSSTEVDDRSHVHRQFEAAIHDAQRIDHEIKRLHQTQEYFIIQYEELSNSATEGGSKNAAKEARQKEMQLQLQKAVVTMLTERERLVAELIHDVEKLTLIQHSALHVHLTNWVRAMKTMPISTVTSSAAAACFSVDDSIMNGGSSSSNNGQAIHLLQQWSESLAELLWAARQGIITLQQLLRLLPLDNVTTPQSGYKTAASCVSTLDEGLAQITGLLSDLVRHTLIVLSEPPRVLNTRGKFESRVALLVGYKLNLHMTPPQVSATIVSESQARHIFSEQSAVKSEFCSHCCGGHHINCRVDNQANNDLHMSSGELLNATSMMSLESSTTGPTSLPLLTAHFRNMNIKRIKRADPKGESGNKNQEQKHVTEEKIGIIFHTTFSIGSGQLCFNVRTLSAPIAVISHVSQAHSAEATILWDCQFGPPNRLPFVVPSTVAWHQLAGALCSHWNAHLSERPLELGDLSYLATKLSDPNTAITTDTMVEWRQFNKTPLAGRTFTFWDWFYGVEDLIRRHLSGPWDDRLVVGFISKDEALDALKLRQPGTFMLRFCDSETGGISVAWVATDDNGENQLWNLQPWFAKDFAIRSLADRLRDLPQLVYLYPDLHKDDAFGRYYSAVDVNTPKPGAGYVKTGIAAVIPGANPVMSLAGLTEFSDISLEGLPHNLMNDILGEQSTHLKEPSSYISLGNVPLNLRLDLE